MSEDNEAFVVINVLMTHTGPYGVCLGSPPIHWLESITMGRAIIRTVTARIPRPAAPPEIIEGDLEDEAA